MGSEATPRAPMTSGERRHTAVVASVFAVRMFGLFLMLPVLAVLARDLPDATPALIGLAVGAYGITQALLQIPLGSLSDRVGRRPVVAGGLLVFALGSVVAALSGSVVGVIAGRILQGAGAISAALTASVADRTRAEVRTRAMALVGATIGISFVLAMVAAPVLAPVLGLAGLFWLSAVLALLVLVLAWRRLADPPPAERRPLRRVPWRQVMATPGLPLAYVGVFLLHAVLTASFVTLPQVLADDLQLPVGMHSLIYLGALLLSLAVAVPMIFASDRSRPRPELPMLAFGFLAAGQLWLAAAAPSVGAVVLALTVFFAGFNFLEARLPALVTQLAPDAARGTALGLFATGQFLGAFVGGWAGGALYGATDAATVFTACALAGAAGAAMCRGLRRSIAG